MKTSEMFSRDSPTLKKGNSTPLLRNLHPFLMTITLILKQTVLLSHIFLCTYSLEMFKLYLKCKRSKYIYIFLNDKTQLFLNNLLPADKYASNDCFEDHHGGQRGLPELGTVSSVVLNSVVTRLVIHMAGIIFSL